MNITAIAGFCIISAILALVLRQYKPELALVLSMACSVVVLLFLLDSVADIRSQLEGLLANTPLPPELLEAVFKGLGVCVLSELAASLCRDAGETAIAVKAELAGKVALMIIGMPLFYRLLQMAAGLLTL